MKINFHLFYVFPVSGVWAAGAAAPNFVCIKSGLYRLSGADYTSLSHLLITTLQATSARCYTLPDNGPRAAEAYLNLEL